MKKVIFITTVVLFILMLFPVELPAQCAMCGASVQSSEEGAEMAAGLNTGILYLLVIPYVIFMTFAVVIFRTIRKNKKVEQTAYFQN